MKADSQIITKFVNFNEKLTIPFFQRAYVWQEEQWERLIDDVKFVTRTRKPYFMGSVILKEERDQQGVLIRHTVIDGQQRLTTFAIFYKVFSLITNQSMWFNQTFKRMDGTYVIEHSHNTKDDFEKILNLSTLEDIPENDTSSNIIKVYNYFKREITEILNNDDSKLIPSWQELPNLLTFVVIILDSNEDEQQIFDTINSLGVKLTTGELLKNYFYNKSSFSLYETTWKPVFESDAECLSYWNKEYSSGRTKRNNLEVFFYSFLQIKLQDASLKVTADDKDYFGRYENLFNNYKNFISKYNVDRLNIVAEILEYAKIYKANFDFAKIKTDTTPAECGMERINTIIYGMEANTIVPYILYVLKNVASTEERNAIFKKIESYLMRRYICQSSNRNYNRLFSENLIGRNILSAADLETYLNSFRGGEQSTMTIPTNDEVTEAFKTNKLYNKQATCILYLLETSTRSAMMSTDLRPLGSYTLEHLMPKKWRNNWDNPTECTEEERDKLLLTLGNLAIIPQPLNSSIRDANWQTKLNGKNTRSGLKNNTTSLVTMQNVLSQTEWNETTIKNRAKELARLALNAW